MTTTNTSPIPRLLADLEAAIDASLALVTDEEREVAAIRNRQRSASGRSRRAMKRLGW